MHDSKSAISVQNLIAELARTVKTIAAKDAELDSPVRDQADWLNTWSTAFWETICREWASIDQWRMNKVLLLVRFFLRETFGVLLTSVATDESDSKSKSSGLTAKQIQILETWPLSPRERKVPDGLRLHVLDIWVDELAAQIGAVQAERDQSKESDPDGLKTALIDAAQNLMTPVDKVSKEALSKGVKMRAKDAVKAFHEKSMS